MIETMPYTLIAPLRQAAGLVLTSPHSGRRYGAAFLAASRLDSISIRRSEDSFVDELVSSGPGLGVPLLAAEFPRAYCDANREPWELDPAMFADALPDYVNSASPRVQAGLGTIARIVGTGEPIYAGKLRFADAQARIATCWQPYHDALAGLINETRRQFGSCLVLDCHSMPSLPGRSAGRPDIILGDGFGTSCSPAWADFVQATLGGLGFQVRRNDPYAGGFITRHYGRPRDRVQVIQVEIARSLYMNERNFSRNPQFSATQKRLASFLAALVDAASRFGTDDPEARSAAAE
jgi:N-formylglutamate deformylase